MSVNLNQGLKNYQDSLGEKAKTVDFEKEQNGKTYFLRFIGNLFIG